MQLCRVRFDIFALSDNNMGVCGKKEEKKNSCKEKFAVAPVLAASRSATRWRQRRGGGGGTALLSLCWELL